MRYPDLNKNSCMWYDCKTRLSTENNYKISPANNKDKTKRQVGDYDRIRFERRKDIFK